MRRKIAGTIVLIALLCLGVSSVYASGMAHAEDDADLWLGPGGFMTFGCTGAQLVANQVDELTVKLSCLPPPTATPVPPTPTVVPTATASPTVTPTVDLLGMTWHPPQAHGDRPTHEHGDEAPQWVYDAGYTPMFEHQASTVNENVAYWKHTGFKGWLGKFGTVDWYGIFHLDSIRLVMPADSIPTSCGCETLRVP